MAKDTTLTAELVRQLLNYDPETGALTWKPRTPDMFKGGGHSAEHICARWNSRYAGKEAGCMHKTGYRYVWIGGKLRKEHRVIWVLMHGEHPENDIDHINGARADNRISNLREATRSQNYYNRGPQEGSAAGLKGVHWHKKAGKWCAQARIEGGRHYLGRFETKEAAHEAYVRFTKNKHKEFARNCQ